MSKCYDCEYANTCKKKENKSIKKTIEWKEFVNHKIDPNRYVLTYSPGYKLLGLTDSVYRVQKGKDVEPDVLMWGYIEDPVVLH